MKTLDIQARLEYARAAVAVLRALAILDMKMSYGDFAGAIGIMSHGDTWKVWHRQQIKVVLNLVAASERQYRVANKDRLQFERIVSNKTKAPGPGFYKTSKIQTR